jgi:Fe-S oxidoreductase
MPNFNWRVKFDIQKDPPMGILYIGAVLEEAGYNVCIIDANAEQLTIDEVLGKIIKLNPDFIGISANYSPLNNLAIELSERIKNHDKNIMIAVGGNHATASYRYMLEKSKNSIDFIIRGQGEIIFLNLLNALNAKADINSVKGISYLKDDKVICTSSQELIRNLDDIPMPAYHLLNMDLYNRYNLISSRGCPYKCTYCASSVISSNVCYRSPENIVQEIEHLIENYGHKVFWFSDDTFTSNFKHTNKLLDLIIEKNLNIRWSCLTRVNRTNKELLNKMKKAGCIYISYGVESGDVDMIEKMNKKITLQEVREALKMTKEVGIDMYTFFLIGYPGETIESVNKSFDLIRETQPTGASFAVVIPLPGTSLWEYLYDKKYVDFDTINWDYLFAKSGKDKYENYAAKLASTWCDIEEEELLELCEEGQRIIREKDYI